MLKLVKDPPLVKVEDLSKSFGPVRALSRVSFELEKGHIVGLLGPNGSGKTTLIKTLAGLYTNYKGKVLIDENKPSHLTKAIVAYQGDRNSFPAYMQANEIVSVYKTFFADFNEDLCQQMLDSFDIRLDSKISHMSKGTADKLQIALTMSRNAKLYLLDEPLGGIDPKAREKVLDTILNSFNTEGTIIVVTHLISQVEQIFDTAILLSEGRLVYYGDSDEIRRRTGHSLEESI